jgi:hypothetical protein
MKPLYLVAVIAVLLLSACLEIPTATPSATATMTPSPVPTVTAQPTQAPLTAVSRGTVWIRNSPGGKRTGEYLSAGDVVTVLSCQTDFCNIERPFGWVFRGCLKDLAEGRGCSEAR